MLNFKATLSNKREITFPATCQKHANNYASRYAGKAGLRVYSVKQK